MDGAVALFESSSLPSPSSAALSFPTRSDYSTFLNESIPHFLTLSQTPASDFSSNFRSVFFRLINSSPDPPIEVLWFYSAVVYRDSIASSKEMEGVSTEISGVRDLLQMLITSSATWTGVRSIALVAPVIFEACRVVRELDEGREGRRKVWKEMDELVDGIIGYICICCVKKEQKEEHESTISLLPCFGDVVRVWMMKSKDEENWVRQFFPLISVEIYDELVRDGSLFGGDVEYLASVVCVQAFMLKLFLKFRSGRASEMKDLGNGLRVWAVSSITGIGSIRFFEMLLKILLEPTLPSIFHLNPKDETFLHSILCDAVLLSDYKFLHSTNVEDFNDNLRSLAITRLIVSHEAIQTAQKNGDHSKVMSYFNAFSRSHFPLELTKWITNQIGTSTFNSSNATTPQAILRWILKLEEQGFKLFDINILKDRLKFFYESEPVCDNHILKKHNGDVDPNLFFIDNKGETPEDNNDSDDDNNSDDEKMEIVDRAFLSAALSMSKSNGGRKKRKEMKGDEDFNVKFVKYTLNDNSAKDYFSTFKEDVSNSGSEVENPISDEDMEET